jgi:hypothetical protein
MLFIAAVLALSALAFYGFALLVAFSVHGQR